MEITLRSVGKVSSLSGTPLEAGATVESFLFRGADGELERMDLLVGEVEGWTPPGGVLCRWSQMIKDTSDPEAEARRGALHTAEELFMAMVATEAEAPADEDPAAATDRRTLLTLLALMLERKRVLKPRGRGGLYWHVGRKELLRVPLVKLTPELLGQVADQLESWV